MARGPKKTSQVPPENACSRVVPVEPEAGMGGDTEAKVSAKHVAVHWDKDPSCTERLLDWLESHPADRQKFFSDSSKDAKDEGRLKHVAKGAKAELYGKIAFAVFSVDDDQATQADYSDKPERYIRSVENFITWCVAILLYV